MNYFQLLNQVCFKYFQIKLTYKKTGNNILLEKIKSLFSTKKDTKDLNSSQILYCLSIDGENCTTERFNTISKAIEATKGREYYIFELSSKESVCKGRWSEYILQKES